MLLRLGIPLVCFLYIDTNSSLATYFRRPSDLQTPDLSSHTLIINAILLINRHGLIRRLLIIFDCLGCLAGTGGRLPPRVLGVYIPYKGYFRVKTGLRRLSEFTKLLMSSPFEPSFRSGRTPRLKVVKERLLLLLLLCRTRCASFRRHRGRRRRCWEVIESTDPRRVQMTCDGTCQFLTYTSTRFAVLHFDKNPKPKVKRDSFRLREEGIIILIPFQLEINSDFLQATTM